MAEIMRDILEQELPPDADIPLSLRGQRLKYRDLLARSVIQRAINGDSACIRIAFEYLEGRPPVRLDVAGVHVHRRDDLPDDPAELKWYRDNLRRAFPALAGPNGGADGD